MALYCSGACQGSNPTYEQADAPSTGQVGNAVRRCAGGPLSPMHSVVHLLIVEALIHRLSFYPQASLVFWATLPTGGLQAEGDGGKIQARNG